MDGDNTSIWLFVLVESEHIKIMILLIASMATCMLIILDVYRFVCTEQEKIIGWPMNVSTQSHMLYSSIATCMLLILVVYADLYV